MDDREHLSHRKQNDPRQRARCPECKTWIILKDDLEQWDLVDCPQCKTRLELTDWRPPTLSVVDGDLVYEDDDWIEDSDNDF